MWYRYCHVLFSIYLTCCKTCGFYCHRKLITFKYDLCTCCLNHKLRFQYYLFSFFFVKVPVCLINNLVKKSFKRIATNTHILRSLWPFLKWSNKASKDINCYACVFWSSYLHVRRKLSVIIQMFSEKHFNIKWIKAMSTILCVCTVVTCNFLMIEKQLALLKKR